MSKVTQQRWSVVQGLEPRPVYTYYIPSYTYYRAGICTGPLSTWISTQLAPPLPPPRLVGSLESSIPPLSMGKITLYFSLFLFIRKVFVEYLLHRPEPQGEADQNKETKCAPSSVSNHTKSLQSCPTLCDPMDYSPPGSSVHGISLARILEWVAMPSSKGSS